MKFIALVCPFVACVYSAEYDSFYRDTLDAIELWNTDLPALKDLRSTGDFKMDELFCFEVYKLLKKSYMQPILHRLFPVSFVHRILRGQDKRLALADEYEEIGDTFLNNVADTYGNLEAYTTIDLEWAKVMKGINPYIPLYKEKSLPYLDPSSTAHEELVEGIKSLNSVLGRRGIDYGEKFNSYKAKYFEILKMQVSKTCLFLEKYEAVLKNTNNSQEDGFTFRKKNWTKLIIQKIFDLEKADEGERMMRDWVDYLCIGKLKIEQKANVELLQDRNFVGRHVVKYEDVVSQFISSQVRDSLNKLASQKLTGLPLSVGKYTFNLNALLLQLYANSTIQDFIFDVKVLSGNQLILQDYEIYLHLAKKLYKFSIDSRRQKIETMKKEHENIMLVLRNIIKVFIHLAIPKPQEGTTNPFVVLYREVIKTHDMKIGKLESEISALEQGFEQIRFPRVEEAREKVDRYTREIELSSNKLLTSVNRFQLEVASLLYELATTLKAELMPFKYMQKWKPVRFDSTDELFDGYVNKMVPKILEMINFLKSKNRESTINIDESANTILEDEVVSQKNILVEDLPDLPRFSLSDYVDYPLLCPTSPVDIDNVSHINKASIVVGTFNAQWLFPFPDLIRDEWKYVWKNERKARRHFMQVLHVIAKLNADILLLQEVQDCRTLTAIVDALKEHGISDYSAYLVENKDMYTGQHVGVLTRYKPSEVKYIEADNVEFSKSVPKNIFARFHFLHSSGRKTSLALVGLHLIAGELEKKRNAQAECVVSFVQDNVAEGERLLILGDMNDYDERIEGHQPYSQCLNILSGARAKRLANAAKCIRGRNLQTQSTRGVIDHILGDPSLKLKRTKIHSDLVWLKSHDASDHAPVTAEIRLF